MNDHDLLITLHQEMKEARKDIKTLSDNVLGRVQTLEQTKADKIDVEKAITATASTIREERQLKLELHAAEIARLTKIVYGACAIVLVAFITSLVK